MRSPRTLIASAVGSLTRSPPRRRLPLDVGHHRTAAQGGQRPGREGDCWHVALGGQISGLIAPGKPPPLSCRNAVPGRVGL